MSAQDGGAAADEVLSGETEYVVSNEFARVVVRKVFTHNGERLEIRAPYFDALVRLDPLHLECLARGDVELLLKLLRPGVTGQETAGG